MKASIKIFLAESFLQNYSRSRERKIQDKAPELRAGGLSGHPGTREETHSGTIQRQEHFLLH